MTFSDVGVRSSGGLFQTMPFSGNVSTRTCDLKKLVNAEELLGTTSPPTGHYTQIRLVVASATLYFDSPRTARLRRRVDRAAGPQRPGRRAVR